jgi:hypothetical protein
MADNVKDIIRAAQSAEIRGDNGEAVNFLRQAASLYQAAGNTTRAQQMLRHAQRLKGEVAATPTADSLAKAYLVEQRGPALADAAVEAWCSFCCRPSREVGKLVAGPASAFICGSCASQAQRLVAPAADPKRTLKPRRARPRSVKKKR